MRIAVFVSGGGTNLQALLDAEARGELTPASIVAVVSNKADAFAVARATTAGVPVIVIDHRAYPSREAFDEAIVAALRHHQVELIVLAGFMRILSASFTERFPHRIINTHPSLLPAFPGTDAPGQALRHGAKLAGVTVHFVDATLDGGPIIAQRAVAIEVDDTTASLTSRIQAVEHRLLPEVVAAIAQGRVTVRDRLVKTTP